MGKTYAAIIVAGGSGSRMQAAVPKQFLPLQDKPILWHTIQAFRRFAPRMPLVVVLPQAYIDYWQAEWAKFEEECPFICVAGGASRFHSVWNGLQALNRQLKEPEGVLVGIHDGARPLVSVELLKRTFEGAAAHGSAIPVVQLKDSIREVSEGGHRAVDRSRYRLVQTPQVFDFSALLEAYARAVAGGNTDAFTDDASVMEAAGHRLHLVEGDYRNLKITTAEDLTVATAFMAK